MSVILIVEPKCTPAVLHPAPDEYANKSDRPTDGRQTVTLRFPLEAASQIIRGAGRHYLESSDCLVQRRVSRYKKK